MGRQIILKEDGTLAIYSSIVDDFIADGISIQEYIDFRRKEVADSTEKDIREIIVELKEGRNPYHQFQLTYEEAIKLRNEIHKGDIK